MLNVSVSQVKNSRIKVAVYTGDLCYSTAKGVIALLDSDIDKEICIFLCQKKIPLFKKIKLQLVNLRKNGANRILEVLAIILNKFYSRFLVKKYSKVGCDEIVDYISLVQQHEKITIVNVSDINGTESIEKVKKFSPDIGVSIAAPILTGQLLNIAKLTNLNLHKGKLPAYRGMPPAFWEVFNKESSVTCSIHVMSEALDEGALVAEQDIPISQYSTPKGLQLKLDEIGVQLMADSIDKYLCDAVKLRPQTGQAATYTKPLISQERKLKKDIRDRHNKNNKAKSTAKDIIFTLYSSLFAPVRSYIKGLKGQQDVIVILYHRVNDEQRDSLTVGVEQFYDQMNYISRRFPIASFKALISGEVSRYERKPIILVSFDDGYLDNYEHAFPICVRTSIPCSFFVSTDMIDKQLDFPHDKKHKYNFKNMNWTHLREMKQHGMFIGSHTCTHINCADAKKDKLQIEFKESQKKLNEELGQDMSILAYPFGGLNHFSDEARELAKVAGYKAILSAYGGVNHTVDLFDIKRGGIDYTYSHAAFKARLFGWKQ